MELNGARRLRINREELPLLRSLLRPSAKVISIQIQAQNVIEKNQYYPGTL